MNKSLKLCICAGGIFVCYFYYGIIQERITRGTYKIGDVEEKFTFILALVGFQCLVNTIYAFMLNRFVLPPAVDTTTPTYYAGASLTYLLAMVFSNKALQWVNYPTQVVGKSCKPIPVMLMGVLLGRKRHPLRKYLFVLTIVAGVAVFMYKDDAKAQATGSAGLGEILLLLSLTMDGLTGAIQERMKTDHKSSSGHMMYNMNLWGVMYLSVGEQADTTVDAVEAGIFDLWLTKQWALKYGASAACIVLKVGQIIMAKRAGGPKPCENKEWDED